MTEEVVTRRRILRDGEEVVQEVPDQTDTSPTAMLAQVVYFVAGLVEAALALRFILQLLGANRANGVVDFIYGVTAPVVAPFFGMFSSSPAFNGVSRFEVETLVAMIAYAILAWILVSLFRMVR